MLWIGGAVLVIGIVVFLGAYFSRGSDHAAQTGAKVSQGPVDKHRVGLGSGNGIGRVSAVNVPASPTALGVARTFLETAVARKHLDMAWGLVGPWLKGIKSRAVDYGQQPRHVLPRRTT